MSLIAPIQNQPDVGHWFRYMGITYETQSEQGFYRIRLKMTETYAWKGFEYDLPHPCSGTIAEPVPRR